MRTREGATSIQTTHPLAPTCQHWTDDMETENTLRGGGQRARIACGMAVVRNALNGMGLISTCAHKKLRRDLSMLESFAPASPTSGAGKGAGLDDLRQVLSVRFSGAPHQALFVWP